MTDNLSPSAPPETDDIPTSTTKTVDLTPEQRSALFGDAPTSSGDSFSVVLKAGDVLENGGAQTFEVVSSRNTADSTTEDEEVAEGEMAPDADETSSDDEKKALGYDRGALTGRRKKQSAKVDMDALGRD